MRVEQLMSQAKSCCETDSVRECAKLMKEESIGFVPVCTQTGEVAGAVTDRDLAIRVLADGRSAEEPVLKFMTADVVSCRVGDSIEEAERLMREHRLSRVMVCDDQERVQGVISLADIAQDTSERGVGETLQEVKSDQPGALY